VLVLSANVKFLSRKGDAVMCERSVRMCTKLLYVFPPVDLNWNTQLALRLFNYEMFCELNNENFCNSITWKHKYLGVDTMTACKILVGKHRERGEAIKYDDR
jgi:hypothetical protein